MEKRLGYIKEQLMSCVESQMMNLEEVDAKELGEVIDMIKDIEEALYYCTVTKAMEEYPSKNYNRDMDREMGKMYYENPNWNKNTTPYKKSNGDFHNQSTEMEYGVMRDSREGRSPATRKMYMEHKEIHADKAIQMKELENYMQELTQDIVEMIEGASPEEKQYLNKRITALANKIV
jgi:hypothetical protein